MASSLAKLEPLDPLDTTDLDVLTFWEGQDRIVLKFQGQGSGKRPCHRCFHLSTHLLPDRAQSMNGFSEVQPGRTQEIDFCALVTTTCLLARPGDRTPCKIEALGLGSVESVQQLVFVGGVVVVVVVVTFVRVGLHNTRFCSLQVAAASLKACPSVWDGDP